MSLQSRSSSGRSRKGAAGASFSASRVVIMAALLCCAAFVFVLLTARPPSASTTNGDSASTSSNVVASVPQYLGDPPPPLSTEEPTALPYDPFPSPTPVPPVDAPTPEVSQPPDSTSTEIGFQTLPNVAWGVEGSSSLVIRAGTLNSSGTSISNIQVVATWPGAYKLTGLVPSPNGALLAASFISQDAVQETEGIYPTWVQVIDLTSGSVQPIPDPSNLTAYRQFYFASPDTILGWSDNSTLVLEELGSPPVLAGSNGASYSAVSFSGVSLGQTAMSVDGKLLFFGGINSTTSEYGWWKSNVNGSSALQIVAAKDTRTMGSPIWSPSGRFIAYVSVPSQDGGTGYPLRDGYRSLWVYDMVSGKQGVVDSEVTWHTQPVWSPDSGTISFLKATAPIPNDQEAYGFPNKVDTQLAKVTVTATLSSFTLSASQTISSLGRHYEFNWVDNSSLLFPSDSAAQPGGLNSTTLSDLHIGGPTVTLVTSAGGETIVHPVYITSH